MAVYHNDSGSAVDTAASSDQIKSYIVNARPDAVIFKTSEVASYFVCKICKRLFGLLLKDDRNLDTSLSLADLGLEYLLLVSCARGGSRRLALIFLCAGDAGYG
jgi:hypothetical protein